MPRPNQPASDGSDQSAQSGAEPRRRLRPSGGYRKLRSYQVATVIYDATADCPICGKPMAFRTARKRARTGSQFWGMRGIPRVQRRAALGSLRVIKGSRNTVV